MGTSSVPPPLHDHLLLGKAFIVRCCAYGMGSFGPWALTVREELPLRCRDFMVPGQACWDRAKLLTILSPGDVDCILEVPISLDRADTLIWGDHDSGLYTVRSGYLFLRRPPSPPGPPPRLWKILAKLPTIPKVRSFGWRCGRDALPVGSRLRDAGLSDGACPLCGFGFEDVLHVLRDCPDSSTALCQAVKIPTAKFELVAWDDICLPKAAGGIGFNDLHLFNIALLGKQIWRLLSTPDSLLCRTLRAKYFPDGDLFGASAPARSSFAWKGLHRAMLRLRDGFFWTLGINSQVRLFRDRWGGFSPIALDGDTVDREELPLRCRDFMVPGQACWDRAKLLTILSPGDVDCILEVPISLDRADTLIWGDHDSGLYTVRSGYLFLRRPPSPPGPPPRLWKILAKLPTIPKVRSFGWRCGRDALPVGSRLRDAGLSDGACPLCGFGFEDVLHVLRDYPDSSTALCQAGFTGPLLSTDQVTVVGWLGLAASSLSLSSFALLLSVLWGLWRRRNTWVHERSLYPLHLVVEDAVLLCRDYASASASAQVSPLAATAPPHWRRPPVGSIKVNVDGAFLPSARLGAIGVIARDSSGAVLGGFAKPIPIQGPASTVEVAALFAGLEFAIANDWPSALIESDAAVLVNKLHRPTADLSLLGDMLAPSRALLAANAARFRVGCTPRLANIAAHTLASWACNNNDVITFSSVCPESSLALYLMIYHLPFNDIPGTLFPLLGPCLALLAGLVGVF
ncbi:hypothetical protein GQ457_11G026520 [Hibiscus cannabinus]